MSYSPNIHATIVVIDNNRFGDARSEVREARTHTSIQIDYVHQTKRGIASARNTALMHARSIGVDWIAFIDDDETADEDWLAALMAEKYSDVPVLMGFAKIVYPSPAPFWVTPKMLARKSSIREGQELKTAATNNVRFSMALVDAGLRFDEGLGFMGGEDSEFFAMAKKAGFEIRWTNTAITYETAHAERLTYRGQIYRAYWCAASQMRESVIAHSRMRVIARKIPSIPSSALIGFVEICISPLFLVAGTMAFKRRALAGGKKLAKAAGRIAALTGRLPEPYRVTVGS